MAHLCTCWSQASGVTPIGGYKNYIAVLLLGVCETTVASLRSLMLGGQDVSVMRSRIMRVPCVAKYATKRGFMTPKLNWRTSSLDHIWLVMVPFHWSPSCSSATTMHSMSISDDSTSASSPPDRKLRTPLGNWKVDGMSWWTTHIREPAFIRDVALVCAALHNVCERANCPFNEKWNVELMDYVRIGPALPPLAQADLPGGCDVPLCHCPICVTFTILVLNAFHHVALQVMKVKYKRNIPTIK